MEKLYKLTNQNWETRNKTKWGPGVTHTASGAGRLCSPGWLHAYTSPLLAVLLNPIHADISDPVLWEAEGLVGTREQDLKVGCLHLTTIKQIPLPIFSRNQKIKFALACAMSVYINQEFATWANNWISGKNRSYAAATAAAAAARFALRYLNDPAATAAAYAAATARFALRYLNDPAATAAAYAAQAAVYSGNSLDLHKLASEAYEWKDPLA